MPSLVILMIEAEQPEGLSARKLVVETAKHNVLTAYSMDDGLDLLRRFPKVDAIFIHSALLANNPHILSAVKEEAPGVPVILASPFGNMRSTRADFIIDSHHPQQLLELLTSQISIRQGT